MRGAGFPWDGTRRVAYPLLTLILPCLVVFRSEGPKEAEAYLL
jgi:hypothetical protein